MDHRPEFKMRKGLEPRTNNVPAVAVTHSRGSITERDWALKKVSDMELGRGLSTVAPIERFFGGLRGESFWGTIRPALAPPKAKASIHKKL